MSRFHIAVPDVAAVYHGIYPNLDFGTDVVRMTAQAIRHRGRKPRRKLARR